MGIYKFKVKNILLIHFCLTVLWSLRLSAQVKTEGDSPNELHLAKKLDMIEASVSIKFLFKWIGKKMLYVDLYFELCSKLIIKILEEFSWYRSNFFNINFEQMSCLFPCFCYWLLMGECTLRLFKIT